MNLARTKAIMQSNRKHTSPLLIAHPELAGMSGRYRTTTVLNPGSDSTFGDYGDINFDVAADIYKRYTWLRRGMMVKFLNIAPLPVQVIKKGKVTTNPLNDLFNTINPNMDSMEFWAKWSIDLDLAGDSYTEIREQKGNKPLELWRRRPDNIDTFITENTNYPVVRGYNLVNNAEITTRPSTQIRADILPKNMIHMKNPDPTSEFTGSGIIMTLFDAIDSDTTVQKWMLQLFRHGARPDFVVYSPLGILASEKQAFEDQLLREHGGVNNSFKPIFLETEQAKIEILSFKPTELEWLKLRELSPKEVAAMLGVPLELMGIGKATFENFSMAMESFWNLTLLPLIKWRDQTLTTHFSELFPLLKPGETIQTDISTVKWLQTNFTEALAQGTQLQSLSYNTDEINERLNLGMPETIEGGNNRYVASNMTPINNLELNNAMTETKKYLKHLRGVKKQIPGTIDNLEDAPVEVVAYQEDLNKLVEQAQNGDINQEAFEDQVEDLVIAAALLTFSRSSNTSIDDLSTEARTTLNEQIALATSTISVLAADIYGGRFVEDLNISARLSKWGTNMLQISNLGKTYLSSNPLQLWRISTAKDNCPTCLRLNGQVHSVEDWRKNGFWPQCHQTVCRGYSCGCRWEDHEGPARGGF